MNNRDIFKNPGCQYRGKPFWAWNGKLEERELRRQLDVMKEMGFGGAFMHSRVGLDTVYLSPEWFRLVKACADQCRKNGMEAWMYDEDRWPSGAAGGIVTRNPKYRMRYLALTVSPSAEYKPKGGELAVFAAVMDGNEMKSYRRIKAGARAAAGENETILSFKVHIADKTPWHNGFTYLDTMSGEAVRQFIKVTHEAYAKNCKKDFGRVMPGIFTDEPYYGRLGVNKNTARLLWTGSLPRAFKRQYGYDLIGKLPELVFRLAGDDFSKARHDYFQACTSLFTSSFAKQIYDWCARHGVDFTGHVLEEQSLKSQTQVVGAAMRFYEYMQSPGIDILCAQGLTRDGTRAVEYLTAKQCCSVLDQFGRKWMLSELYGCTGWHFTFAEHKAVGDWQAAMGVNLRCHHLAWYTMEGEAKRDYPASIFFHSPWWRHYPVVEDYFARVNCMLIQGRAVRDVAVIHPIESAWGVAYQRLPALERGPAGAGQPIDALDARLKQVQQILLEEHYDFDYIDEDILARHGAVGRGKFKVAKSSYSTVIVPPAYTLRQSTCDMLDKFARAGGNVVFVEPVPGFVNAEKSDFAAELASRCSKASLDRASIMKALEKDKDIRKIAVKTMEGGEYKQCLYMMRQDKAGRTIVFVCHTLQDRDSGPLTIEIPAAGQVQEWDAATGQVFSADARKTASGVAVKTILHGYGSRLFVVDPAADKSLARRAEPREISRQKVECGDLRIARDEPNAFPLDAPEYSLNGGEWRKAKDILKVDDAVREFAKWPRRGGAMCQPWAQQDDSESQRVDVALRYSFEVEEMPTGPCHLVIERPEKFTILLNNCELKYDEGEGWWIDGSFKKVLAPPRILKPGVNELVLKTSYGRKDNLESLYFAGEFGFKWRDGTIPVITGLPATLRIGDWSEQGFPCYSGSITYAMEVELNPEPGRKIVLEIPEWKGALAQVFVNGRKAGAVAWPPYEVDITTLAAKGTNRIGIEVVGTRRNLLGPLHHDEKYPPWTGPAQFKIEDKWTSRYVRFAYGLMAEPVVSVRE